MTPPPDRDDTSGPTGSPMSPAERQRRHRARKCVGVRMLQVEVSDEAIARLIALGWLSEVEAQDRSRVTIALENMIDCYGRGTLDPVPVEVSTSTNL